MHVSLCMSYFFSYVHNRLLSCFSGPLYMYQAFVFINEEICSLALSHDKEKKNPACEKIEQRQAQYLQLQEHKSSQSIKYISVK